MFWSSSSSYSLFFYMHFCHSFRSSVHRVRDLSRLRVNSWSGLRQLTSHIPSTILAMCPVHPQFCWVIRYVMLYTQVSRGISLFQSGNKCCYQPPTLGQKLLWCLYVNHKIRRCHFLRHDCCSALNPWPWIRLYAGSIAFTSKPLQSVDGGACHSLSLVILSLSAQGNPKALKGFLPVPVHVLLINPKFVMECWGYLDIFRHD